jgi:hypothetical protein
LVVCVAWRLIRDQWPGFKNACAHRVCDILWGAVGGDVERQSNIRNKDESPPENSIWVRHLKAVKTHQNGEKARYIERILVSKRPPDDLSNNAR